MCESLTFCFASEASELDSDGEPSAASIVRKWRAQKLEDDERILLQEKVFNAEEHFRNMCAAGGGSNNNAEAGCSIGGSKCSRGAGTFYRALFFKACSRAY